jgi:PKD repeat protein
LLAPPTLPNGTTSIFYNEEIIASGGSAPYTFEVTSGSLPPGLDLFTDGPTFISGTPTTAGTFPFVITATDSSGCMGSQSYTITIAPCLTLSPLPDGVIGVSYNQTITASGGAPPYTFSVTAGSLPPGLTLSSGGVLSGTPTTAGSYSFTVSASDGSQCTGSRAYTVTITSPCPVITLSPASIANGTVGETLRRTFSASGGTAPYTFGLTAGSLPPGLSLSTTGFLSGSPTTPGTYSFTVTATDANDCSGSRAYTLTIVCPTVTVLPEALVGAAQGTAYSQTLTASGGREPHSFAVTGGALPAGLALSPEGVLSGTPEAAGTFTFTVTATDASGCSGAATYTLSVCVAGLILSPGTLPAGTVGSGYGQTLVASGGAPPYAFAVTSGALPAGLTLSAAGVLSGTPTAAGLFSFTVTATDVNGCPGVQTYALRVCPVVAIAPTTLPEGAVGTAYSQALTGSGGTGPYTFAASGSLPPGLALSPTGVLSGTPTQTGSFSLTVTATDANGCPGVQGYTVVVTDPPPVIEELNLAPADGGDFGLSVTGSGFVSGAVVVVDGVSYPTTFVSPTLVTVVLPASAVPATGSITVTVTNPGATGGTSNPASLTFCSPPGVPLNPTIAPAGNPTGPITATDFLQVSWDPPSSDPAPVFYEYRINGDPYTRATGTSAIAPPRGINDPITLYVRAHCNGEVSSPEVASATYSLAPPVADFTFSSARVGSPVIFTDISSPQATSWLWIFDDGATSTEQSPTHTFTTAGTHRVALIASNGSGSDLEIKDVSVSASTSSGGAVTSSVRSFQRSATGRARLPDVAISGTDPVWLELTSQATEEAIVYLRFIDSEGWVVLERRLSVAPGQPAVNDVSAYGLVGVYTLEIVSSQPITALLAEPVADAGEELRNPMPRVLPWQ